MRKWICQFVLQKWECWEMRDVGDWRDRKNVKIDFKVFCGGSTGASWQIRKQGRADESFQDDLSNVTAVPSGSNENGVGKNQEKLIKKLYNWLWFLLNGWKARTEIWVGEHKMKRWHFIPTMCHFECAIWEMEWFWQAQCIYYAFESKIQRK